jgi:hypothetical protein
MLPLAALAALSPLTIEHAALVLGLVACLGLLAALYALERSLDRGDQTPPLATALAAVCYPVTGFASSGLESLHERRALLARKWGDARWLELTGVRMPGILANRWALHRYDRALVDRIRAEARELRITEFEPWIRKVYLPRLASMTRAQAQEDLRFLDTCYWEVNGHDALREELVARIEALP